MPNRLKLVAALLLVASGFVFYGSTPSLDWKLVQKTTVVQSQSVRRLPFAPATIDDGDDDNRGNETPIDRILRSLDDLDIQLVFSSDEAGSWLSSFEGIASDFRFASTSTISAVTATRPRRRRAFCTPN